ncbi:PAS domain S-box protein [Pseudomonas indica]|uniref:histidine kinase n=2 Tax=Pseudomonas indica TaxID=137658 RepID=A0A1G9ADD3_9PSED|nr:PAS domain S-box-containing protein [Pseudomonas indica]
MSSGVTNEVAQAMQGSEWLQDALVGMSTGVALLAGNGSFVRANPALCAITGFSETELAGRNIQDLLAPEDVEAFHKEWEQALRNGATRIQVESNYLDKQGRTLRGLTHLSFQRHDGQVRHIVLEITETTERRKAEAQRLRERLEQNQWLEKVTETAPGVIGIYRQGADGRHSVPSWSTRGYEKLFGLNPAELVDDVSPLFKQIHPGDYERVMATIAESARTLEPWRCEYRIRHPERGIVWIEGRSQPTIESDGSIIWYGFLHDVTERKQIEQALRESEERFRKAFECAGIGMALLSMEGRWLSANRTLCDMLGYTEAELLQTTSQALTHPDDQDKGRELLRQIANEASLPQHIEKRYRHRDGHFVWVRLAANVVTSPHDTPPYYVSFFEDITQDKAAQERLALLDFALDHVHEAAYVLDMQARFHYVNHEACRSLGYSEKDLLGMSIPDIAPDYSLTAAIEKLIAIREDGTGTFETVHRTRAGDIFPVEVTVSYFTFNGKEYNLALARDISRRKRLEAERQERERHYREVFENSSDCLYLLEVTEDERFRYLEINAAFERVSGWPRSQLIGRFLGEFAEESTSSFVLGELRRALRSGASVEWESELMLGAGPRTIAGTMIPVRDEHGRIYRVVGVSRDITESKHMEELLRAREQQFRTLAENSPHIIVRYDRDLRRIYVNKTHERELGVSREKTMHAPVEVGWGAITPIETYKAILTGVLQTGQPAEAIIEWPSIETGEIISYATQFVAEKGLNGEIVSVLAKCYNVTAMKKHERQEEARLRIFEHLAHGGSLPEVLTLVAEYMEKTRPDFLAAIMLMDDDKKHLVFGAAPSLPESYNSKLGRVPIGEGIGTCGTCAWRKETVITEDISADPNWRTFSPSAVDAGLMACWSEPILDSSGEVLGTFCIYLPKPGRPTEEDLRQVHQVTHLAAIAIQRKRDETRLKESEQRYREIFDNSMDALFLLEVTQGGEFRSIEVNPAGAKLLGIPHAGLIGQTLEEALPGQLAQRAIAKYHTCLKTGTPIDEEIRLHLPIGTRDFHLTLIPLHHESGHVYRVIGIARDITERKRAEQILHRREEEFRALVENAPDFISRYDTKARCLYANPAFENLLGVTLADLRGKRLNAIPDTFVTSSQMSDEIMRVASSGIPAEAELLFDGLHNEQQHPIVQHVRLVPECDRNGSVTSILAIGRDISAIRAAERSLEESHARLRDLSRRRETAREEERKRIAREIHDELGQHLTALRMGISLLRFQFGKNNPLLVKRIQGLMTLVDKTIRVVRNVASSLRPAALNMGLPLALEWLVTEFTEHTGLECHLEIPKEPLQIDDEHATAAFRVVQESLTNIARHAAASRVDISLSCNSGSYLLEIADNGKGFDTTAPRKKTFGLVGMQERGLMLGGKVSIISSPGNGTTIRLQMPVNIAQETP